MHVYVCCIQNAQQRCVPEDGAQEDGEEWFMQGLAQAGQTGGGWQTHCPASSGRSHHPQHPQVRLDIFNINILRYARSYYVQLR